MLVERIGPSTDGKNLYRFVSCGHEQLLFPGNVSRSKVKCRKCYIDKCHEEASASGFEIVTPDDNISNRNIYRFKLCKHEKELQHGCAILSPRCEVCFDNQMRELFKAKGFNFIEKNKASGGLISCITCGQIRTGYYDKIKDQSNKVVCKNCESVKFFNKLMNACAVHNLTLLQHCPLDKDYFYFKLPCGCTKRLQAVAARNNSYNCSNCKTSWFDNNCLIYLLELKTEGFRWLKLGISRSVESRVQTYSLLKETAVSELITLPFDTFRQAQTIEKSIHKKYKHSRLSKDVMSNYMMNGFTECYPTDLTQQLISEFQEISGGKYGQ